MKWIKILLLSLVLNLLLGFIIFTSNVDFDKYTGYPQRHGWFEKTYPINEIVNDSVFVILTLGQSNAANCAKDTYQPTQDVYNYYNGKIYKAEEPLKGANGNGGISVWSRLADKLIKENKCKKVVIIPIAKGGTNIEYWSKGEGNDILKITLQDLKAQNIKLTHILWHQGEADNGGDVVAYKNNLESILNTIRQKGQKAPFYCAIATYNSDSKFIENNGVDFNLQSAQKAFIEAHDDVLIGANTDNFISAYYRYDGQHFSSLGNIKHSQLWYDAIASK